VRRDLSRCPTGDESFVQQLLSLVGDHSEPELAAQDFLDLPQAVSTAEWRSRFAWRRPRR
jgi:hypothetical protein